jgi:hypothetical protein
MECLVYRVPMRDPGDASGITRLIDEGALPEDADDHQPGKHVGPRGIKRGMFHGTTVHSAFGSWSLSCFISGIDMIPCQVRSNLPAAKAKIAVAGVDITVYWIASR